MELSGGSMKLSNDQTKTICELFEIPPEGADLISFFFTEEEIRFLLAVSVSEIGMPVPVNTTGIDTAKAYRRGLLNKTDETGDLFRLNDFYGFLDVFCISNYEKYQSLSWEKRVLLDEWYFREYLKTLDNGQEPPTSDRVLPLEEIVEEILSDPRPVYLNYCDCRSLTGACGLPRHTCITYKNGINTFADRGLSEQIDPERAAEIVRQAEKDGLMHTSAMGGICNCCGDCCYLFRAQQARQSVGVWPASLWVIAQDEGKCVNCGKCIMRCHMQVFAKYSAADGRQSVIADPSKCAGCGICRSTCPAGALELIRRKGTGNELQSV